MGFLRKFFPLALAVAFLGAPLLAAHAEDDTSTTTERAPASKKKNKKKNKKAHGKKGAKKNKKAKAKGKKKAKHARAHSASHAPVPTVDHSGEHLPVPGDVPAEQKPDLPPPNAENMGK